MAELNSSRMRAKRRAKATLVRILGLDAVVRLQWGMGRLPTDLESVVARMAHLPRVEIRIEGD